MIGKPLKASQLKYVNINSVKWTLPVHNFERKRLKCHFNDQHSHERLLDLRKQVWLDLIMKHLRFLFCWDLFWQTWVKKKKKVKFVLIHELVDKLSGSKLIWLTFVAVFEIEKFNNSTWNVYIILSGWYSCCSYGGLFLISYNLSGLHADCHSHVWVSARVTCWKWQKR